MVPRRVTLAIVFLYTGKLTLRAKFKINESHWSRWSLSAGRQIKVQRSRSMRIGVKVWRQPQSPSRNRLRIAPDSPSWWGKGAARQFADRVASSGDRGCCRNQHGLRSKDATEWE